MTNTIPFFMQNQDAGYSELSSLNFTVGVVDPDDSGLTTSQIATLNTQGKTMFSYLDVGEAENFRSYWQSSWDSHPPSFVLAPDQGSPGDYLVAFWNTTWQGIMVNYIQTLAKEGYNGVFMDMGDAYTYPAVVAAYNHSDGTIANAYADYIIKLANAAKEINPNFKVMLNNGTGLLSNANLVHAIDGFDVEQPTFNSTDTALIHNVIAAGKTVTAINYDSTTSQQAAFIAKAVGDGYVPFESDTALDGYVTSTDYSIKTQLPANALSSLTSSVAQSSSSSTPSNEIITGTTGTQTLTGNGGNDTITAGIGNDSIVAGSGNDSIVLSSGNNTVAVGTGTSIIDNSTSHNNILFSTTSGYTTIINFVGHAFGGNTVLEFPTGVYSTPTLALMHVAYSGGNAFISIGDGHHVELMGVALYSLNIQDF